MVLPCYYSTFLVLVNWLWQISVHYLPHAASPPASPPAPLLAPLSHAMQVISKQTKHYH